MQKYYIISYEPDGKGAPYFFDVEWSPELPEFHYPTQSPSSESLCDTYYAIAEVERLQADWLIDHFLGSDKFKAICDEFQCPYLSRKVVLSLSDGQAPLSKVYSFFVPSERLRAMDVKQSSFVVDSNDKLGHSHEVEYERIDNLVMQSGIKSHLFYFEEIKEFVCSDAFLKAVLERKIVGLSFSLIDTSYRYAPWDDF
ncbi:hypothetical protein N5D61_00010 [Pseudomonas sp. GD03842]|uniref:hypothetical protein n=1 Tax=Pseudomonas sp. GD03842 TaxID=2975385 RepID=UPI002446BBEE|nr:hypothetical protein [Pseudomonas sp. GD03842]MDH0744734.1 hypothetical protein [Pseudomonas sp. GD03842]